MLIGAHAIIYSRAAGSSGVDQPRHGRPDAMK